MLRVRRRTSGSGMWMRTTLTRLTFEPGPDYISEWTPDGRRVVFSSRRGGSAVRNLFAQAGDGTGSATALAQSENVQDPTGITADGTRIVFNDLTPTQGRDIRLLTLVPTPRVEPLVETRFQERGGIVSPDGRWLAYESDSSGRFEIYVRPFPNVGDGQWQVSTAGGVQPLWARNGRELFFVAPDEALMTVPVELRSASWTAGTPTKLLEGRYYTGGGTQFSRHYDVTPDGQRFLVLKESGDEASTSQNISVVQNWTEELKRLVPVD